MSCNDVITNNPQQQCNTSSSITITLKRLIELNAGKERERERERERGRGRGEFEEERGGIVAIVENRVGSRDLSTCHGETQRMVN